MSAKHRRKTRAEKLSRRYIKPGTSVMYPSKVLILGQSNRDFGFIQRKPVFGVKRFAPNEPGAKEQERAKRCWMEEAYPGRWMKLRGVGLAHVSEHRSKPIMCQMSKRDAQ